MIRRLTRGARHARSGWVGIGLAVLVGVGAAQGQVPEPDGYRMQAYRTPVPATLAGARVLNDDGAHAVWSAGAAVFVDVLPRPPRPAALPEGTIWRDRPRQSIPGAIWLVNVGYGALAPETEAYFATGLARVTGGDSTRPLVFFCRADCWMSWNAARRALSIGYANVSWYPNGTDGWSANDWPLQRIEPMAAADGRQG